MDTNSKSNGRKPNGKILPLAEIKSRAEARGYGILTPQEYETQQSEVNAVHECGTTLRTTIWNLIKTGHSPCPKCSKRKRGNQAEAEAFALSKGGKLIEWKSPRSVVWECKEGHRWTGDWIAIRSYGYWCKKCSYKNRFTTQNRVSPERAAAKILDGYKRRDRAKGRECSIQLVDIVGARNSLCVFCGRPASGMDRKNNEQGHTADNCVPACLRCNWMRGRYISYEVMLKVGALLKEIDP